MTETDKEARIRLAGEVLTLTGELIYERAKLSAVGEWFNKTRFRRGQISNDAWIALYKILEDIPEDDIIIPIIRRDSELKENDQTCSEKATEDG